MKVFIFLSFLLCLFSSGIISAQDNLIVPDHNERRYNPLPPGPTRIHGQIVDKKDKPIAGAEVTVKYPDKVQKPADTFKSNQDGYFTAYIFRSDQAYVDLEIRVKNKLCRKIRYDNPGKGRNIGFPYDKIVCK